ncbi:NTP transferase domain-containing protein [Thiosulfativibrio zosterae]|uniref:Sugar nucleotidyltransferase n=1 Tax=Thiosulfativibrio zosterae TaxID=2675053 RepID=A0A6F8PLX0_9GAMM|nr:phosphocholine cytidylyltransferase family protein [Thiosulfativibrio zosterae]BBP43111.1 sugar nucleotidyltransferase [Thiosulfativibrio zosterae]
MRIIILAAGQGTRLRPYTNDRPKCMVSLNGKPLLHYQLDVMNELGIDKSDIALVGGYLQEALVAPGIKQYRNEKFAETNMLETLFCAEEFMTDDDLIIAYGDIVYKPEVLQALIDTEGDVVITADLEWEQLWSLRMENPLDDAETFKMNDQGFVIELGKKPQSNEEVQAQYMGLIKVSREKVRAFKSFYQSLDRKAIYDGKDFDNMYMTSFIQNLIDGGWKVKPALIKNGWVEVDTVEELKLYEKMKIFLHTKLNKS